MKSKLAIALSLLCLEGCVDLDPHQSFRNMFPHLPGLNFDSEVRAKSLFRVINNDRKVVVSSSNRKTISYLVTWDKDCTYIAEVDRKTRLITNAYIFNNTAACRTNGF